MLKAAFVVQRYGLEVNGGAELHCRWVAEHMSKYWNVEVVTTCAIDYLTWKNEYSPGKDHVNGIPVQRFQVDEERDIETFNQFSRTILRGNNSREAELKWMKLQGPYSTDLFSYIENKKDYYDYFIFFTYLYATTFFGLPMVKEKAILVPTAHDEPPIYLNIFDKFFHLPIFFIYNSQQEKKFLSHKFNYDRKGEIVGVGIDCPDNFDGDRFCKKYNLGKKIILYIGRIDVSKGCDHLFEFFLRFRENNKMEIDLVLLGKKQMDIPENENIIALDYVSEQDKFDALDASRLLIIPSFYESLSMVTLEAFLTKTPVLANGRCLVLKDLCKDSNGGLYYNNYTEFSECLDFLLNHNEISEKIGHQGSMYASKKFSWKCVEDKYLQIIDQINTQRST